MPLPQSQPELLDTLFQQVGCAYLSDLKNLRYRPQLRAALFGIAPETFPYSQWLGAARYLLGGAEDTGASAQLRQSLLDSLSAPEDPST
jgi:hypothetical protein